MSGIAAILSNESSTLNEPLIVDMASMMARQGPRYQQYWYDNKIALAHTLLSTTVESENESQPSTLDRDIWISADARIDAREDLISKIKQYKPRLHSEITDDKLILHAYQIWGDDCLQHMIGDFAFIIWDSKRQKLLCATDQFGVTPLYYAITPKGLCVSNNLNAIRLNPEVGNDLDEVAIADYLLFRINENSHGTFYKHIKHVPAGHCLIHENNATQVKRYWSFEPRGQLNHSKPSTYIEDFSGLLKLAVADRARTQSVGLHLSGGMDSSSVTALAHELTGQKNALKKITAYTYSASGTLPDLEMPFATEIAQKLNIEHHACPNVDDSLESPYPEDLRSPEPRFSTRNTTNYNLLTHASTHSNVLLTGFGGDPLLRPQALAWNDINSPNKALSMLRHVQHHRALFGKRPSLGLKATSPAQLEDRIRNRNIPDWINDDFATKHNLDERFRTLLMRKINPNSAQESMTNGGLWRRIFCWNDPGFTHIPIKVAHPFFDTRLLEFSQTLPPFPWLYDKTILRQSMRNYLPDTVIQRPKTPLPGNGLQSILTSGASPNRYQELLNNKQLLQFIDPIYLQSALKDLNTSNKRHFKSIIRISTLSDWLIGAKKTPTWQLINGNKDHVKRIT